MYAIIIIIIICNIRNSNYIYTVDKNAPPFFQNVRDIYLGQNQFNAYLSHYVLCCFDILPPFSI